MLYMHVPSFLRKGNGKWRAEFHSAWPKRQDANKDDIQADRTQHVDKPILQ